MRRRSRASNDCYLQDINRLYMVRLWIEIQTQPIPWGRRRWTGQRWSTAQNLAMQRCSIQCTRILCSSPFSGIRLPLQAQKRYCMYQSFPFISCLLSSIFSYRIRLHFPAWVLLYAILAAPCANNCHVSFNRSWFSKCIICLNSIVDLGSSVAVKLHFYTNI